jgi:hypothetical protein
MFLFIVSMYLRRYLPFLLIYHITYIAYMKINDGETKQAFWSIRVFQPLYSKLISILHIYMSKYIWTYAFTHAYMYYVCMNVCMYVRVCMYVMPRYHLNVWMNVIHTWHSGVHLSCVGVRWMWPFQFQKEKSGHCESPQNKEESF